MPARLSWVSSSRKPSGSIRCSWVCVAAHNRATLPVFGGISGSTRTMCMGPPIKHFPQDQPVCGSRHASHAPILLCQHFRNFLRLELAQSDLDERAHDSTTHFVKEPLPFDDK